MSPQSGDAAESIRPLRDAIPIKKIDHVSIAVPRIRDVLPLYRDLLGGELVDGGDHLAQGYRWIQFIYPGSTFKIELIEPLDDDGFAERFLDKRGPGMHHILVYVPDLPQAIEMARDAGYEVVKTELNETGWSESFLHPKSTEGVLIELGWAERDIMEREDPADFPHSLEDILKGKLGGRPN